MGANVVVVTVAVVVEGPVGIVDVEMTALPSLPTLSPLEPQWLSKKVKSIKTGNLKHEFDIG